MRWILIIAGTILGYILISFGLKITKLKKNVVGSKLAIQMNLKKKDNIVTKLVAVLNEKDNKISIADFDEYIAETDFVTKICLGNQLSEKIMSAMKKEYRLQMDGEIGMLMDSLQSVDAILNEMKNKYELSKNIYETTKGQIALKSFAKKNQKDIEK